ncbi:hypothetical protein Kpho02_77290 [Kitasatospora phosalacinea]|uniref:Ricin B lectin domain-containing protein n=1 Tax=Kitasatospora phosalacinea TaxID=2065 RepID=A0A9W6QJ70_9ACTN|nr:RICIN domain-containing protein [Kitasatospora phosalacinea]GLW75432.1 hypothetical protein Kpho02_77290 [Kitasatospora phosalacinea]
MRRKIIGILGMLVALAGFVLPAAPASAATDSVINPPGHYALATEISAPRCLVVFSNGSHGSQAVLTQCANYDDQSWYVPGAGSQGTIRNKYSGQCLTAQGGNNGAPAFTYQCTGLVDQQWRAVLVPYHNGSVWYQNVNSGKCLVVQGNSEGTAAMQYDCGNYADQYWQA